MNISTFLGNSGHKFWGNSHIREKLGPFYVIILSAFWSSFSGQIAYKGKCWVNLRCCILVNLCHEFPAKSHIRGKHGTHFSQFMSRISGQIAYKGKTWVNLTTTVLVNSGHDFWPKMHIRGKVCVIFRQFWSRFLAQNAYKGKSMRHFSKFIPPTSSTILGNSCHVFDRISHIREKHVSFLVHFGHEFSGNLHIRGKSGSF